MAYFFEAADEQTKRNVWTKGREISGEDPNKKRRDICGSVIHYDEHGQETEHGWEIDHIRPVSRDGLSTLDNLQPLHWSNNRRKGNTYPWDGS